MQGDLAIINVPPIQLHTKPFHDDTTSPIISKNDFKSGLAYHYVFPNLICHVPLKGAPP